MRPVLKLLVVVSSLVFVGSAFAVPLLEKTITVRVIAFNDFHGNIDGANLTLRSDVDGICVRNPSGQCVAGVPAGGVDDLFCLPFTGRAGPTESYWAGPELSLIYLM